MCPECFLAFSPPLAQPVVCPHCGYEFPKKERSIEQDTETQLIKVEGFRLHYDSPDECMTYRDLRDYAKRKGYKLGWAYYQAKKRGLLVDTGA